MSKGNYLKLSASVVFLGLIYVLSYAISDAKIVENNTSAIKKSVIDVQLADIVPNENSTIEAKNSFEYLAPVKMLVNVVNNQPVLIEAKDIKPEDRADESSKRLTPDSQ